MYMQWITDFLALIAAAGAAFGTVGTALWFLIGMRVAPVQRDVCRLGKRVDNLSGHISSLRGEVSNLRGEVSDLRGDMNAKFSEFNGKFDVILILLEERAKPESEKRADSSKRTTSRSKRPAKGD